MTTSKRLPVYAVSHGGGPWPWIKDNFVGDWGPLERSLQAIPGEVGHRPRAILCVTAHWIEPRFTVQTHPSLPMLYDYQGFPEFTYHIRYPAPGSPEVAERVAELVSGAGLPVGSDARRGFDHGTFMPLAVAWPAADVPVVQLSIRSDFGAAGHLELGRALAPLRDEGVLIFGSGVPSFHDLSKLGPPSSRPSATFDRWLRDTMLTSSGAERTRRLERWRDAPSARECHPEADHFLPLLVVTGAAEDEPAFVQYHEDAFVGWTTVTGFRVGETVAAPAAMAGAATAGLEAGS
jgi:aromatic ring-opening dioxygenase catalytic subunit (LigB family)